MMATLDVMQRAAAAGKNMVITHEPTFYSHQDAVDQLKDDATYQFKLDFIRKNNMVSFHFHDHWHGHRPDGIAVGMARELGWEKNGDPQNPRLFSFPATPLAQFAKDIAARLKIRTMRVVGDPALTIQPGDRELGIRQPVSGYPATCAARYRCPDHWRSARMGDRRIRAGYDRCGQEESPDRSWPRRIRAGGDEVLRGVVQAVHPRSARRVHPRGRTFLEA